VVKTRRWTKSVAPAKKQTAIRESNTKQPNDDVGMNGQMGCPHR
jgi:hypothetical protein